jgi:kynurenine formamidase
MRLLDLSQPLYDGAPNCPAHPPVKSEVIADHPLTGWRVELLTLASHTGSHVDTPFHKLPDGANLDQIPLDRWTGQAFIADLQDSGPDRPLDAALLADRLEGRDLNDCIVLLATGWGRKRAKSDEWLNHPPYVSPDGARWLVQQRIRGVGIDHFSIAGSSEEINPVTHTILLEAGIWIVEELSFPEEVFALAQPFEFMSLPINLRGHTGAFCRPVAIVR